MKVKEFDLNRVRIIGGPLKKAMELNKEYLLQLEPDRLLSRFREYAGLKPKAENYPGWEAKGISGHTLGHYLSACSIMGAASGEERFFDRVHYIVDELEECQEAHGNGYIGGVPRGKEIFEEVKAGDIRSQGFDLNGGWVPLYSIHKVFAGLHDAYKYAQNVKALHIEAKLGLWLDGILQDLDDQQVQEVLNCEFGGMSEVLADLAADTGDDRFWKLSERFHHRAILDPLAEGIDDLAGKHANTQIPKIVGAARQYELSQKEVYRQISEFFWHQVVRHHSYVIGGNSMNEHFGHPGQLNDRLGANTCETCNSYNMLKLTKHLFQWNVLAEQGDFYERVLFNHILASQHPVEGTVTYFVSLDMGGHKVYNSKFDDFTCCVGSGMENHAKYGEGIYFYGQQSLFINQFIPSRLDWHEKGIVVNQSTDFPENGSIKIDIECSEPAAFSLFIRYPYWAEKGVTVKVNGGVIKKDGNPSSFIEIERKWKHGDTVDLDIPMPLRVERMPDNENKIAFMKGPLVLAGDLGPIEEGADKTELLFTPVLVTDEEDILSHFKMVKDKNHHYVMDQLGHPRDVSLVPFCQLHDRSTTVYWDVFTKEEWKKEEKSYRATVEKKQELEQQTVDFFQPGEMQPERDHEFEGEHVGYGILSNRKYRDTWPGGYFSFTLNVLPDRPNHLLVMYTKEIENMNSFDLTADGAKLQKGEALLEELNTFVLLKYELPLNLTAGKKTVRVQFRANEGQKVPKVFGVRMVRDN